MSFHITFTTMILNLLGLNSPWHFQSHVIHSLCCKEIFMFFFFFFLKHICRSYKGFFIVFYTKGTVSFHKISSLLKFFFKLEIRLLLLNAQHSSYHDALHLIAINVLFRVLSPKCSGLTPHLYEGINTYICGKYMCERNYKGIGYK